MLLYNCQQQQQYCVTEKKYSEWFHKLCKSKQQPLFTVKNMLKQVLAQAQYMQRHNVFFVPARVTQGNKAIFLQIGAHICLRGGFLFCEVRLTSSKTDERTTVGERPAS